MKQIFFLLIVVAFALNLHAQEKGISQARKSVSNDMIFIENKGQWSDDVLYLSHLQGMDVWITRKGVQYDFYKLEEVSNTNHKEKNDKKLSADVPPYNDKFEGHDKFEQKDYIRIGHRVWQYWEGTNVFPMPIGKQKQSGYHNYLIGNDKSKYASFVGLYKEVKLENLYAGINVRYYFDKGYLRYDYEVNANADASMIKFRIDGDNRNYISGNKLLFDTRFGATELTDLTTFYAGSKEIITSKFTQKNGLYSIALGSYDRTKAIVIDPLIYSTYLGGSNDDYGTSIVVDNDGNVYITGSTGSSNFSTTSGAYQTKYVGRYLDAFITKLNPTGSELIYSTYLGGDEWDHGLSIANNFGNTYITGFTDSPNLPTTSGAYQTKYGSGQDAFVTKLNATGSQLLYSTYLGGKNSDAAHSIAIDIDDNAYITGSTYSENFPVTSGAYQTRYGDSGNAFITKIKTGAGLSKVSTADSNLIYSTYLGGRGNDYGRSIAVDNDGNAYITGETKSFNFPITSGAYQTKYGGSDAFITKLNAVGSDLIYSTFLGGNDYDEGQAITVDEEGNTYITGEAGYNFPTTSGAYQTKYGGGAADAFMTKLNAIGSKLIYSTYLGGSEKEEGFSIAVDEEGNAHTVGFTYSNNFPTTSGSHQTKFGGHSDAFMTKLNITGDKLIYSTYLGGNNGDTGISIAIDSDGYAYITGATNSQNFPVTSGAYQTKNYSDRDSYTDAFITKLDMGGINSVENILSNKLQCMLYPNPSSNGAFVIEGVQNGTMELTDITGKVIGIYQKKEQRLPVQENLPKGIYFIRHKESGSVIKFVVE